MSRFELAQLNIAKMKEPLDSPLLADFVSSLDRINAVADTSAGFVWRLQTTEGDATSLRPLGEETLVNMSAWRDVASLRNYVYRSAHVEVMRRQPPARRCGALAFLAVDAPAKPRRTVVRNDVASRL